MLANQLATVQLPTAQLPMAQSVITQWPGYLSQNVGGLGGGGTEAADLSALHLTPNSQRPGLASSTRFVHGARAWGLRMGFLHGGHARLGAWGAKAADLSAVQNAIIPTDRQAGLSAVQDALIPTNR